MRGRAARIALLAATSLAVAGCGIGEMQTPDYVAIRRTPEQGGLAALLNGRLTEADGCLWIAGENGGRSLPLWPAGTRAYGVPDGPSVVVEVDGRKFVVGSLVSLGGGERTDVDGVEPEVNGPIPSLCREGPFWWVSSVETVP